MKQKIAILASGSGSNAEKITAYFKNSDLAEIKLIITNNPAAFVITRANKLGVPCIILARKSDYGVDFIQLLEKHSIDFIVLAGFLWLIPKEVLLKYPNRIINVHPALLPKYGGKGMYGGKVHQAVSEARDTETGISIHYVNENYDEGDIIFQARCRIEPGEDPDSIAEKVHSLEYEYYPKVIEELLNKLA